MLIAGRVLIAGSPTSNRAEAFGSAGIRAAAEGLNPVPAAACRERRGGWDGWGWVPLQRTGEHLRKVPLAVGLQVLLEGVLTRCRLGRPRRCRGRHLARNCRD